MVNRNGMSPLDTSTDAPITVVNEERKRISDALAVVAKLLWRTVKYLIR